jgi:hypothetical protein
MRVSRRTGVTTCFFHVFVIHVFVIVLLLANPSVLHSLQAGAAVRKPSTDWHTSVFSSLLVSDRREVTVEASRTARVDSFNQEPGRRQTAEIPLSRGGE